jgi:membrane associated rhomboid family serine protease
MSKLEDENADRGLSAEGEAARCYRHPSRETNVACSNCGRPICPECMTPTPVGMRCPDCAGRPSGVQRARTALRAGTPYATYGLLAINVIVFLAELGGGGGAASIEGGGQLIRDGGLFGPAISNDGEYYRIVTSGFLHAGPLHLGLNMFVLYILGTLLEPAIGTLRMLAIYFVSMLAGSFGALLLDPDTVTVGASGAIYGLMAATFVIARHRGIEQLATQIGFWLVLNLAFTFSVPNISIGGHLGGLVGGFLAALAITAGERGRGRAMPVEVGGLSAIAAAAVAGAVLAAESL